MPNLELLSNLCSTLQIAGLGIIIISSFWKKMPLSIYAIIYLGGFSGIVKILLPNHQSVLSWLGAFTGLGIIIVTFVIMKRRYVPKED